MGDKTSHGIWASQERMEEFDDFAEQFQDKRRYSRTQAILDAMDMYETVLETMDNIGYPRDMTPRERRAAVRQALIDMDRERRE